MEIQNDYLFVYGTLLDSRNPYAGFLRNHSRFKSNGKFKGELYDVGDYPGAVLLPNGDHYVHGTIFRLLDADEVLKELDDYEGFGDEHEKPNEFVRTLAEVDTGGEMLTCWVYTYNHPVNPSARIKSGRYR
jgi:gamma-glutamylcyclotransferase (GGCT)/AIG2-like uncharacterized protein YtfP